MSNEHPEVLAARAKVGRIRKQLVSVLTNSGPPEPLVADLIKAARRLGCLEEASARALE